MNEYTVFGTNVMYEESMSKYYEETNFERDISEYDEYKEETDWEDE